MNYKVHLPAFAAVISAIGALAVSTVTVAAAGNGGALHASAVIIDSSGNSVGTAKFTESATGTVHVNVKVSGLSAGLHGIHIHAVGACSPTFGAAGPHHNPTLEPHGMHSGDLPNLIVNSAGEGRLNAKIHHVTLSTGPVSVFDADGSAIVIHADPDDFLTQPTGNSGARVACGVLAAT